MRYLHLEEKVKTLTLIIFSITVILIPLYVLAEENENTNTTQFYQNEIRHPEYRGLTALYSNILQKNQKSEVSELKTRDFLELDSRQDLWYEQESEEDDKLEETGKTSYLSPYLWSLRNWRQTAQMDEMALFPSIYRRGEKEEKGIDLPLDSNLQINGYKSIRVEYNHTHYFGKSDINRFYGLGYSGSRYSSGLDFGFSDYSYSGGYNDYGGYSDYGGGYSSYDSFGGGYGGYSGSGRYGVPRASGLNIEQELQVGLHGRIGKHTNVSVDYSDTGSNYYSGFDNKQQKIRVWYEGDEGDFIKRVAFGDIMLNLPNARFLSVNRNLFGLEMAAEVKGIHLTAFGSRSKGIKEKRRFRGESRRSGYGTGNRVADANYVKERYYAIHLGEDGLLHEDYLPIKTGSEVIYVDDGNGSNNQSGYKTARGYFNQLFPGQDYNIDYQKGEIAFLTQISARYQIVVAYEYLGSDGGVVGNPQDMFVDDNGNDIIDEENDPTEELGYVVIKGANLRGTEMRNVYTLGNRNIRRQDFELSIWRTGGTDSFEISKDKRVPYIQIFGLDKNGDGIVDPEYIDFERGILTFPSPRPFMIDDPSNPYYPYRDQLNNELIYAENPRYTDQVYTIQADYSYQEESYNLGLFVIPGSETVRLGGRKLQRDVDYQIIYEVGSITFFTQLNEYDEIEVEFERTPFGGSLQQTVAGLWAEYSYRPKAKPMKKKPTEIKPDTNEDFEILAGITEFVPDEAAVIAQQDSQSSSMDKLGGRRGSYNRFDDDYGGYSSYGSSYGGSGGGYSSYGGGYGGYSGFSSRSSRRRQYGISSSYFNPTFVKGFSIAAGYIYNTGSKPSLIPDVNEAPSRLQAFDVNTSFGHAFNLSRIFNPLPLIESEQIPLSVNFSGEAAYSYNNPNSVGFASINSMEGAKDTSTIPTFKYNWQISSRPLSPPSTAGEIADDITLENRAIFQIIPKDETKTTGNYMKNREVPASAINPLARPTEEQLIMEIGYDFTDIVATWGGMSHSVSSASGADYSDKEFLEMWLRVKGNENLKLHIDIGVVSEDTDEDGVLDSEDLPLDLLDVNGDRKRDILDISIDELPDEHKYKANGSLDSGEDTGWLYDIFPSSSGQVGGQIEIGKENTVLDTEDLNGDIVLDIIDSYLELTIPLNDIPENWIKRSTKNDWFFLNIPLESATPHGRIPNLEFVKHIRIWLEKSVPGPVTGTLEWASMELVGNQWERGIVTNAQGNVITNTGEKFLVGAKDNYDFEDYLKAYEEIKDNEYFKKLHPYVETGFGFGEQKQRERSLTLNYILEPTSMGFTSQRLKGARYGDGQDFSKHNTLRFWLYGDKSGATFVMRLGSSMRTGYSSYYSYSRYDPFETQKPEEEPNIFENIKDYYEYTTVIDFDGWKLMEISLEDSDSDGHPDGFTVVGEGNSLSITNIGGILLGLKNDANRELSGEVWVNEIHLADPLIRTGWARRGDVSIGLANFLNIRGGYANQDKAFENSAGQTGRRSMMSRGYSTSTYDANINAELRMFQWLPITYSVRSQESESESRRGVISSYQSGKSKTNNRSLGVRFNLNRFPQISFDYDKQNFWNERRGTELSDLYSTSFGYAIGNKFTIDTDYQHEYVTSDSSTADPNATASSSGYYSSYYSRSGDEIVDSGSISLRINPVATFSLNPIYDVRRELERRQSSASSGYSTNVFGQPQTTQTEEKPEKPEFTLAGREHRLSLTPSLNRDFFGIRPSISNRVSFRENWWSGQKDASMNANIRLGLNIRPKVWFGYGEKRNATQSSLPSEGQALNTEVEQTSVPDENTPETTDDFVLPQQFGPSELPSIGASEQTSVPDEANSSVESPSSTDSVAPSPNSVASPSPTETENNPPAPLWKGEVKSADTESTISQPAVHEVPTPGPSQEGSAERSEQTTDQPPSIPNQAEKQESHVEPQANQDESPNVEGDLQKALPSNAVKGTDNLPPVTIATQTGEPQAQQSSELRSTETSTTTAQTKNIANKASQIPDFSEVKQKEIERRERELDRLKRYGIDEEDIAEMESERGDWIGRDKAELERKIRERKLKGEEVQKLGLWRRSIESFSINLDVSFDARDYLRKLDHGESFFDILKLPDDSDKRSRSTIGSRYGFRTDIDPFTWASFGTSYRRSNDFTKSAGTSSRYNSETYEGDVKVFGSDNASSIQLRYSFSDRSRTSVSGTSISKSISHEPSMSWRQSWAGGTKTSTGVRFSLRNQTRSGVKSNSMIITPNFSIDYRLLVKGEWRMPVLNKVINLDHNFDLTNTLSTVIRREQYGVNRDEKSERFETSLRFNYNLSTRLRMNMNLGVSYNKDHVEEGRDYFSVASSVMVRGEFR